MLQNVQRFNNARGGLTPAASNVLYVHGQFDPWRSIGVQTTNRPDSPAIVISGLCGSYFQKPLKCGPD